MRRIDSGNAETLIAAAKSVRETVFVQEQQISPAIEYDDLDGQSIHFVAFENDVAVATARLRPLEGGIAKVERVATLAPYRGRGIARDIMLYLEDEAANRGLESLKLGAQVTALTFYERLGYEAYGEEFLDADLPHRMMRKSLR